MATNPPIDRSNIRPEQAEDVAKMNNISVDDAYARISRAQASQAGQMRGEEGTFYNPATGQRGTDAFTIGRDPAYWGQQGTSSRAVGTNQEGTADLPGASTASGGATIGSLYGASSGSALDAYGRRLSDLSKPVDEEKIRQDAINRVQSEIDAMNRFYAEKTQREQAAARVVGESRLGQNAAISARRGMIGSDFGAARTSTIEQANDEIQRNIAETNSARLIADRAAILGRASATAEAEVARKQERLDAALQSALLLEQAQRERAEKAVDTRIAGLVAQGIEPSESDYDALAVQLGIDKETLKAKYAMSMPGGEKPIEVGGVLYQKQADGSYKALTPGKAEAGKGLLEVSPGASIYDPATGKLIATAPNRPESTRPDVQNFSDGTTRQYNPTTGNWDILATKPTDATSTSKPPAVTDIGGQKMVYDEKQGVFKPAPVQATVVTPANTQQLDQIGELANTLLNDKEGLSDAVGPLSSRLPTIEGSTADFEARHAQLKSLLTKDALSAFKGFGPLSDRDLKIAEDSASALSLSMSEKGYRQELNKILANVANLKKQAEIKSIEQQKGVTLTNEQKDKIYQAVKDPKYKDLSVDEIWGAMGFSQVGGDTEPAAQVSVSQKAEKLASAIAQHETGNRNIPGATGELPTRYQFMPATWRRLAQKYLGDEQAPTTNTNQDLVAKAYIQDLFDQGYNERQIAMIWNGGQPYRKTGTTKTTSGKTIKYDTGRYADNVLSIYNS